MPLVDVSQAVSNALAQPVVDAGARLGSSQSSWPFLPAGSNILNRNALQFVEGMYNTTPSPAHVSELSEYLALATCCHAFDGWRYLSQAALAMMNGARNEALHLAYYAELRAAISIMACSGIGIMKDKHFALVRSPVTGHPIDVAWFPGPTHRITWKALADWSDHGANANAVVQVFSSFGMNGLQWLNACGATSSASAIAQNWLKNWSIDLKEFQQPASSGPPNDSILRNQASYRVDLTQGALAPLAQAEMELIRSAGSAFTPLAAGQFDTIDMAIIYDLCNTACQAIHLNDTPTEMKLLWDSVTTWFERTNNPQDATQIVNEVKTAPTTAGGRLIRAADTNNKSGEAVFCRALLLLRLATALQRLQWQEIRRLSPAGASSWQESLMNSYGIHCHLWDSARPPSDYLDLDADRQEADDNINSWLSSHTLNGFNIWRDEAHSIIQLCRFERLALMAVVI